MAPPSSSNPSVPRPPKPEFNPWLPLLDLVRQQTFPSQYRATLANRLQRESALLETLTAHLLATAALEPSTPLETDSATQAIQALLNRLFEHHQLWEKIAQELWVNLLTWAVQDLEPPIAVSVIQTLAQEPYRENIWASLFTAPADPQRSPPASALEPFVTRLETLISQDLLEQLLETPQILETLQRKPPWNPTLLDLPLPPLTIHPCLALADQDEHDSQSTENRRFTPPDQDAPPWIGTPVAASGIVLEHYLTRPSELYRLPWELLAQIKQQIGLPMAQLQCLLVGHAMGQSQPASHPFTLTYREIQRQLDWDPQPPPQPPPPALEPLLEQLTALTIATIWMSEPSATRVKSLQTCGHPWDILSQTQGPFDWSLGRIAVPAERSITLRPGLWLHHLFEQGGLSARRAWASFGQFAHTLLVHDHCRDPFLISLLIGLSLNAPQPQPQVRASTYTVQTLLDIALATSALQTLGHHPTLAPTLFKRWNQSLAALLSLGWSSPSPLETATPTDFYLAPYPEWLNLNSSSRKPSDWVTQWLAQPLAFVPPAALMGFDPSPIVAPPRPPRERPPRQARLERLTGAQIRTARKAKQLTQSQLADVLHVHQSLIAKIEVGQRTITETLEHALRQALEL